MRYKTSIQEIKRMGWEEYEITLISIPNRISRFFGVKSTTRTFVGECTVWHETTNGLFKRAGTMMESFLSDIESEYKHYQNKKK